MSNTSDIKPDITPTKPLPPFKMCMLNNFPFIDETFDALTNYELLCKVVEYCNKTGENTNIANENVVKLNNAFLELQEYVNESFDDLNIQTYVNNKIDEMILNGDFEEIIINAINSVSPTILDESARVNVFDLPKRVLEYGVDSITYNSTFLDSDTDNKEKLIAIINDMRSKGHTHYYFINNLDIYVPLFKLELLSNPALMQIRPFFDFSKLYLNIGDTYTNTLTFTLTITDNVVTDITFSNETSINYSILKDGNTNEYIPTNSYDPATKDYVDSHAGGSDFPVTTINLIYGYYVNDADLNFNSDLQLIGEKIKEHYETYGNKGYIYIVNPDNAEWYSGTGTLFEFRGINTNFGEMVIGKPLSARPQKLDLNYQDVEMYVFTFTSYEPLTMFGYSTLGTMPKVLTTTNNDYYVPTNSYEPATKDYVDRSVTFGTGTFPYDATNDFTLNSTSYYTFNAKNSNTMLFDIQLNLTTVNNLTGDVIIATTTHQYGGFSQTLPSSNIQAWTGIATVFNGSTDPVYFNVIASFNPSTQLWELTMHIPSGTTLNSGATINLHLNYIRANI